MEFLPCSTLLSGLQGFHADLQEMSIKIILVSCLLRESLIHGIVILSRNVANVPLSRRGASDSVTDYPVFSNPADIQNVSCLGLCGRDICLKS